MHTEHLQRVRLGLVFLAWFIAVAVTSLIMIVAFASNLIDMESAAGTRVAIASLAIGFFAGGLFAGARAGEAPILHGAAIGLLSLFVWFILNVLATVAFAGFDWQALTPELAISLVLLQIIAAVFGARFGYRVRAGKNATSAPAE